MERNRYFENYINNLQKEVFLLAFDSHYNIVEFISCYMKSYIRREMDKPYSSWHNQSAHRILEEVLFQKEVEKVEYQIINRDSIEWLGYFYSKWHFITGETSKTIVRFLPPVEGLKQFYTLHQLDEVEAIEICKRRYNLARNNHRTYEYKNGLDLKMAYETDVYYSFLAVRMLYKLTKNQIFNNLKYIGDKQEYDFVDDAFTVGIKGDVIFQSDNKSLIEKYREKDEAASSYSRRSDNSIYFCFIFSDYYEIDDNDDEKVLLDIKKLKEKFSPNKRHFDYLYFYMLGKLYEITPSNELYIYSMPFSKRERMGIINEMKKNYIF